MQISGQQVSKPQIALRRKRENCPFCRALDDHHSLSEWWAIQKKNPKPSCNIKGTESTVSSHRHFGHVNLLYSLFPRCRCNCWEKKKKRKNERRCNYWYEEPPNCRQYGNQIPTCTENMTQCMKIEPHKKVEFLLKLWKHMGWSCYGGVIKPEKNGDLKISSLWNFLYVYSSSHLPDTL